MCVCVCPEYDAELHLIVRFKFCNLGKYGVPIHCLYPQMHCDLLW